MRPENTVQHYAAFERLFGTELQLVLVLGVTILIVNVLSLIIDEDTSPQAVIMVGVVLIVIAGGALWYTEQMKVWAEQAAGKGLIREAVKDEFLRRSNWFLYILPFVSAAIGTNLISDALTKRLHYKKKLTIGGILGTCWLGITMLVGLALLPIVMPLVVIALVSEKARKSVPRVMDFLGRINRRLYLNLLKYDIVYRSYRANRAG